MKSKLSKITDIPESGSVGIIFHETAKVSFSLKPEEIALWQVKPEKEKTLLIQRLPHYLFLVQPETDKNKFSVVEKLRQAGAQYLDILKKGKVSELIVAGFTESAHTLAFVEGILLAGYSFSKYKKEKDDFVPGELKIYDPSVTETDLKELEIQVDAVCWARDMVNEPLSYLSAVQLSEEIAQKGEEAGFEVEIFHKQKIEALKMGGLMAVNKGSIEPPTFTLLEWKPVNTINKQPIVLVGKGVVFDTGGLSLKPTPKSMDYMKCDMAGAATVAATIYAAAKAKLPVHLIGLVPATDNRPDGNAITPGDIITMFDGTTVEVLNTDAEGRLILADALSYAKKLNPLLVIDLATLTGSASIISGSHGMVAMGNSPEFLQPLKHSGDEVYERMVELPLWNEFAVSLKSDIADMTNLGGRDGQTVIAAKFLEHFTDYPWIHLDIAGTAWLFEKEGYRPKGGTGSGTRLLYNFLKKIK